MKEERKQSHTYRKEKSLRKNPVSIRREMFNSENISREANEILEKFDDIAGNVRNLSGKQKISLYGAIKNLSHKLTDERNSRRLGYMNEASSISAYISYFMWWNLVRMTRLFANLPKISFNSLTKSENPVAIDIGSGTLTSVIALWLSRPELRSKKIKWYCMDLSQTALAAGEDLYLSIAAKKLSQIEEGQAWEIVRIKGALGTSIKEKADFITCANVFNEIIQNNEMPTDFLAKKYTNELLSYLKDDDSTVLLIEPGDPHSARFVTLMRDSLIKKDYLPVSPCPHAKTCPMSGRTNGKTVNSYGKNAKWCNFAFDTDSAPARLLKLSEKAGLPKERAGLSFILAQKSEQKETSRQNEKTFIRIASDFIRLPELHKSGYYACSQFGMLLAVDENHIQPRNGELLQIKTPENLTERDKKSGALIIHI
ncbi:small ribosomal subunit Rsm22 family protein [Treponema sp.]|uniref:small ribosomal subunit Rsm22 family protein n=1 Tax=Treponema sp. TaxID=166 RepID=UPI00388ECACC